MLSAHAGISEKELQTEQQIMGFAGKKLLISASFLLYNTLIQTPDRAMPGGRIQTTKEIIT